MDNDKRRSLVLFTKTFPYGTGENFLEAEIEIASEFYKDILILACQVNDLSKKRNIPQNVKVVPIAACSRKKISILSLAPRIVLNPEVKTEQRNAIGIARKLFCLYFFRKVEYLESNSYLSLKNFLEGKKECIFYSYWFFDLVYLALRMKNRFNNICKIYCVSRAHGYDLYEERNRFNYIPFRNPVLKQIEKVFTCSADGMYYMQKRYPEYKDKFEISYLGTRDKGLEKINLDRKEMVIVTCSNLIPLKRIERLPKVVSQLEEKGYIIKWICFGEGSQRRKIEKYVQKYVKKSKVVFKGYIENKKILEFYQKEEVDVFINLSTSEGLPVSIMEAMSFGIPAIATNVGGTSEIVKNNLTGILLERDFTDQQLVDAIIKMCTSSVKWRKKMRENCRCFWEVHFNNITNYEDFYKNLLVLGNNDVICNK